MVDAFSASPITLIVGNMFNLSSNKIACCVAWLAFLAFGAHTVGLGHYHDAEERFCESRVGVDLGIDDWDCDEDACCRATSCEDDCCLVYDSPTTSAIYAWTPVIGVANFFLGSDALQRALVVDKSEATRDTRRIPSTIVLLI